MPVIPNRMTSFGWLMHVLQMLIYLNFDMAEHVGCLTSDRRDLVHHYV